MAKVTLSVEAETILGDTPVSLQGMLPRFVIGSPAATGRGVMLSMPGRRAWVRRPFHGAGQGA